MKKKLKIGKYVREERFIFYFSQLTDINCELLSINDPLSSYTSSSYMLY